MRKHRKAEAEQSALKNTPSRKPRPNTLRAIGTALAIGSVRASAGRSGLAGMAAGLVFNTLLRRTPMGAAVFGTALVANHAYQIGKRAKARRQARLAEEGRAANLSPVTSRSARKLATPSASPPEKRAAPFASAALPSGSGGRKNNLLH